MTNKLETGGEKQDTPGNSCVRAPIGAHELIIVKQATILDLINVYVLRVTEKKLIKSKVLYQFKKNSAKPDFFCQHRNCPRNHFSVLLKGQVGGGSFDPEFVGQCHSVLDQCQHGQQV